jgi:hypothetical protein
LLEEADVSDSPFLNCSLVNMQTTATAVLLHCKMPPDGKVRPIIACAHRRLGKNAPYAFDD